MTTGSPHHSIEIADGSAVAQARRVAGDLARGIGLDDTDSGRLSIVVTEAATNMLKHATQGELLLRALPREPDIGALDAAASHASQPSAIEVIALDKGNGIADVHAALEDGRSSVGTAGNGLGAIYRLSDAFALWSQPRHGTALRSVVASRRAGQPAWRQANGGPEVDGICVPLAGEMVSGDAWNVTADQHGLTLTLADGLGHGPDAHAASSAALGVTARRAGFAPGALMELCHTALHATRGAALAIARIDLTKSQIAFAGTGNISACGFNMDTPHALGVPAPLGARSLRQASGSVQFTSRNGTVGHAMRGAQEYGTAWTSSALLVMHSDGLATRWDLDAYPGLRLQPAIVIAAVLYRDFTRRRDDATVVVARATPGEPFRHAV